MDQNSSIRIAKAERDYDALLARKAQLEKACYGLTEEGMQLRIYLRTMRNAITERRSKTDPEDIKKNTEYFYEVRLIDTLLSDWSDPKEKMLSVNEELKKLKKVLDSRQKL